MDGFLIGVNIADVHFGAFDPKEQYETLLTQFVNPISTIPMDYILVAGDLYDHKLMGNSDGLYYASMFIRDLVNICKMNNATLVLLHGTFSHDADQLKNFYHYLNDKDLSIEIVTSIKYINIKGRRVLCIPELYCIPEEQYDIALHRSGYYDMAFIHGTFKGAVYGDNVGNGRLFDIHDFDMCRGMIIGGHVHISGCFQTYFYYCGSPYRWKFGEPQGKGYLLSVLNTNNYDHYIHFNEISCRTYETIHINDIISTDPKKIIDYINTYQSKYGIDYLKIKFDIPIEGANKVIIDNFYRNNAHTFIEFLNSMEEKKIQQQKDGLISEEYDFILDNKLSDYEKFVMYVNIREGSEFITVDKLRSILEEAV